MYSLRGAYDNYQFRKAMINLKDLLNTEPTNQAIEIHFIDLASEIFGVQKETIQLYQKTKNMSFSSLTLKDLYYENSEDSRSVILEKELKSIERKIKLEKIMNKI